MTKPFSQCSLPDLAYEISLSARAAASLLLPRLADKKQVTAVLQRHPRVRGASGLVCTGTAENERAWCRMLRDLLSASGAAVSDAVLLRVYNACKYCARLGRVRISDAAAVGPVGGAVADISGAARAAQAEAQPPPSHTVTGSAASACSIPKVKLGIKALNVDSEEIAANSCQVTDADCVAFAARMKTGEISRLKRLYLVRFIVFIAVREGRHEFCRATTKSATRERRLLMPLCNRTAACRGWTL